MKSKIIADVVVIAGAILLFIWWITSIDSELQTARQALAAIGAIWSVEAVIVLLAYKIIKWVNK